MPAPFANLAEIGVDNEIRRLGLGANLGTRSQAAYLASLPSDASRSMHAKNIRGLEFDIGYFNSLKPLIVGLWEFFGLIGAYSSMIILLKTPPNPCPSMNPDVLRLYILYRRGIKGEPLVDGSGAIVEDVQGYPLSCRGGWNAFVNIEKLFTLVRGLHEFHENGGSFQDVCSDCQKGVLQDQDFPGCRWHFHSRRFIRRVKNYILLSQLYLTSFGSQGNPKLDGILSRTIRTTKRNITHIPKGDSFLTPVRNFSIPN
jgi:hypothetical protein